CCRITTATQRELRGLLRPQSQLFCTENPLSRSLRTAFTDCRCFWTYDRTLLSYSGRRSAVAGSSFNTKTRLAASTAQNSFRAGSYTTPSDTLRPVGPWGRSPTIRNEIQRFSLRSNAGVLRGS